MARAKAARKRLALEKQVDEWVDYWCEIGLAERTEWDGWPLLRTPPPPRAAKVSFDPDAVERVLRFFLLLRQTVGRWSGQRFVLLDWQVRWIIAPVFGYMRPDGLRLIRTVWIEVPRKNGKSTLCSGLGLYLLMADREAGAQVYAAAGDRAQAGNVFSPSRQMALGSTAISAALGKKGVQKSLIEYEKTGSIYRVLSADGARQHGLNVHGAVIDEVHVHKTPDLVDALETGVGARTQPVVFFITTADEGTDGSIYATKREYAEGVAAGSIQDPTFYTVVFAANTQAEGFDPFSDETLRHANPGYGVTVLADYLRSKADEARQSPAQLNRYLRLHLNVRTKQTTRWLTLERWDACGQLIDDDEWRGVQVNGGLDLSTTTDFTAYVMLGRNTSGGDMVRALFWLPEERLEELERRCGVPLARWAAEGWIHLTEGNVVDYRKVREDIVAVHDRLGVALETIGYDPWNASETVQLLEEEGYQMVPIRQGYGTLSAPSKSIERRVFGSTAEHPLMRHAGNPVLRWMADCVEVRTDDNGNIKPVKPDRAKSAKRIDGIVALVMAEREFLATEEVEVSSGQSFMDAFTTTCGCGQVNVMTATSCSKCGATVARVG